MGIPFTKMHGIGNDYVYVNGFEQAVGDPAALARVISDRHKGIGSDGLILILPPQQGVDAHVRMRMFNADGSESEMCGNGVRCVAKFAYDHGITRAKPIRVQTGRGVLSIEYTTHGDGKLATATVDMGEPILRASEIPTTLPGDPPIHVRLGLGKTAFHVTCVSMGNPHCVIFEDAPGEDDLGVKDGIDLVRHYGPIIENDVHFPRRTNAHFVRVQSNEEVTMRTWERGSGITLACGTGACAVCVAGVLTGRTGRKVLAHLPGGDLQVEWRESDNHVYMTGPATEVFCGVWK